METRGSIHRSFIAPGLTVGVIPGLSQRQSEVIDAELVDVQPLVEVVTERIPSKTCRPEQVYGRDDNRVAAATLKVVGALLGGSVANVLDRNSSKQDVITGAGALLGGTLGYERHQRRNGDSGYYVTEDICTTEYELRERERANGYRVSYRFGDSIYQTRSATDPGSTIAVRVNLEPLR